MDKINWKTRTYKWNPPQPLSVLSLTHTHTYTDTCTRNRFTWFVLPPSHKCDSRLHIRTFFFLSFFSACGRYTCIENHQCVTTHNLLNTDNFFFSRLSVFLNSLLLNNANLIDFSFEVFFCSLKFYLLSWLSCPLLSVCKLRNRICICKQILFLFCMRTDRLLSSVRKRNTQWMELKRTTLRSLPSSKWQCHQQYGNEFPDICHSQVNHSQHYFYSCPGNLFWIRTDAFCWYFQSPWHMINILWVIKKCLYFRCTQNSIFHYE